MSRHEKSKSLLRKVAFHGDPIRSLDGATLSFALTMLQYQISYSH